MSNQVLTVSYHLPNVFTKCLWFIFIPLRSRIINSVPMV